MNALDEVLAKNPDLAPLEISAAQYVVISVLAKSECMDSVAQLCKDLPYDAGAMTRMLDRLEAKGLISRRRCPDDRRVVKLELTEAGRVALPKMRECSVQVLNHFLRGSAKRKHDSLRVSWSGCCKTPEFFCAHTCLGIDSRGNGPKDYVYEQSELSAAQCAARDSRVRAIDVAVAVARWLLSSPSPD